MKDARAQKLFDLATSTREKIRALDRADMPEEKREETQFMEMAKALVSAFDILSGK